MLHNEKTRHWAGSGDCGIVGLPVFFGGAMRRTSLICADRTRAGADSSASGRGQGLACSTRLGSDGGAGKQAPDLFRAQTVVDQDPGHFLDSLWREGLFPKDSLQQLKARRRGGVTLAEGQSRARHVVYAFLRRQVLRCWRSTGNDLPSPGKLPLSQRLPYKIGGGVRRVEKLP